MFRCFHVIVIACMMAVPLAAQDAAPEGPKTDKEKLSYSLGVTMTRNLQGQDLNLDFEMVLRGLKDSISGKVALTNEEIQSIIAAFYKERLAKRMEAQKTQMEKSKQEGEAFLAANKNQEGVVTLSTGLQYKILKQGDGPKPKIEDSVKAHYRGTLIDGTEFDSSYSGGEPTVFPLDEVIAGWTEALQLMPVGSKWQIFVPPDLGYGGRQVNDLIGPNTTLIFEIELLGIEPREDEEE